MIYLRIMNHNHTWRTMVGFSLKKHAIFSPGRGSRVDRRTNSRATDYFIGALGQHQSTTMEIGWEKHPGNKTKNSKTMQNWTSTMTWAKWDDVTLFDPKKTWEKAHVWPSFDSTARTLPRYRPGILRLLVVCSAVVLARGCLDRVFFGGIILPRREIPSGNLT